jgi:two-component system, NarL family, sensor histidine kinase UhpB
MTGAASPPRLRRQMFLLGGLGVLAVLTFAVLLWAKASSFDRVDSLLGQIEERKTYEELVFETTGKLLEMQSARRAYVLTGETGALDRFEAAATGLQSRVASIDDKRSRIFSGDALSDWASARRQLADYEAHLRASIARRRAQPEDTLAQQQFTRIGEGLAEPIHARLAALDRHVEGRFDHELRALLASSAELQRRDAWLSGVDLLVLLAACVLALREASARGQAQRALAAANAQLEAKVKERTAALRDSEQRYRHLVELSADALLLCSADRTVLFANAAAAELVGAAGPASLKGADVASLFAPKDNPWLADWLGQLWAEPRRHGYRAAALRTQDGAVLPVQVGAVSYQTPGGMQAQIVVQDMSPLLHEQAATREQLQFIGQLVDAIPAPLAVRDGQGRFMRVNRAYELMHRCEAASIQGHSVFDVLPYALAQQVAQQDVNAMRSGGAVTYETASAPTHVNSRELLSHANAVRRADGSLIGVITVDTDVTSLRQKDRELERINAELEALSQRLIRAQEDERRRIARDLHDDVGQLLTLLKMSLEAYAARPGVDARGLQRSLDLTEDALQHARSITASLHPHGLEDLGLEVAVRHLVEHYVVGAVATIDLRVTFDPPRSTPDREIAAFRMIQEACTNAVKHAQAKRLTIEIEAAQGRLLINVSDDGVGFDTGSTVFDRQQKASLGIASMRERVAEIGGEFGIESTPDGGTAVRALLPW